MIECVNFNGLRMLNSVNAFIKFCGPYFRYKKKCFDFFIDKMHTLGIKFQGAMFCFFLFLYYFQGVEQHNLFITKRN